MVSATFSNKAFLGVAHSRLVLGLAKSGWLVGMVRVVASSAVFVLADANIRSVLRAWTCSRRSRADNFRFRLHRQFPLVNLF